MSMMLLAALALSIQGEPARAYEFAEAFPAQERFDKPLFLDHHPTDPDVYYVVEQDGRVWRIPRDGQLATRWLFLDWRDKVYRDNWEEGLLGFAFDPAYADNRQLYAYWSEGLPKGRRQSVVSRLDTEVRDGHPVVVDASELVVITIAQPFGNHNGGTIVFGPDQMLYVALGDGGSANDPHGNGQRLDVLLGKILRLDVRAATPEQPYRVPADNPWVGREGARGEIWATGLRNPWRISFDRGTGDLWCGDVGQNTWEEVDRIVKGGNYGWSWREGNHAFEPGKNGPDQPADLIAPVAVYGRDQGISVTGGYVYRGSKLPELVGWYVYGDFATSRVWAVREDRQGGKHEVRSLGQVKGALASFAEEPDGELLLLCFDGRIHRLQPKGG